MVPKTLASEPLPFVNPQATNMAMLAQLRNWLSALEANSLSDDPSIVREIRENQL